MICLHQRALPRSRIVERRRVSTVDTSVIAETTPLLSSSPVRSDNGTGQNVPVSRLARYESGHLSHDTENVFKR
jgi:hypothetical protein